MSPPVRVLSIGHSYVVALNRAVMRAVAQDPSIDLTVAAPSFYQGDLRPIELEPEPPGSTLKVVPIGTRFTRKVHVFSYRRRALRKLLSEPFDVVHSWEEPYTLAGYQIARGLSKSSARFTFWTAQNYDKRYPPPFNWFERSVLRRAQGWMACAELVRETMIARGYPADACRTLNLAVDLDCFKPLDASARRQVAGELGLSGTIVGYMGRLTADKGIDIIMKAFDGLPRDQRPSLLFLGAGDYEPRLREWARQRGIDRMRIVSVPHGEVPRVLGCMDVLLAPSQTTRHWKEQFGRMITEAFACGVPVIASDSGEIPFVMGDAGIVVGERDVAEWTRALSSMLSDPDERERLRRAGLERANLFSVPAIAAKYVDAFHAVARERID